MYKICLYNNQNEVVIHYPSSNQDDPHVDKLPLKEAVSSPESLSFNLYPDNPGYNSTFELLTIVKAIDVRDDSVRFSGRILNAPEKMDTDGKIYKEITCEGAMSYLNDTKQRLSSFTGATGTSLITQMLNVHNSKVESWKQIYPGTITITKSTNLIHTCEFKSTLAELLAVKEEYGGEMRVRETNGKLYLDWMESLESNTLEITLGINMKDMIVSRDVTSLGTRIIPLGANNLTIEKVNGGLDYIDDTTSKAKYGIIEKTVEYRDIEDATELRKKCLEDLKEHTQVIYELSSNALDLSYLTGNKTEQFKLGVKLHIVNQYMGVDDNYNIVEMSLDLIQPYNPTMTIANKPNTLSNTINDIRKDTIQNDGIYNNVQIGSSFGIRASRSDGKVVTTMNATDGISIENQNKKVFYVDTKGKLIVVDIQADGGEFNDIEVNTGVFTDIEVNNGIIIKDYDTSCSINSNGIELIGQNGKKANIQILDVADGYSGTYIRDDLYVEDVLRVFGRCVLEKNLTVSGSARFNGEIRIGSANGATLEDYINDLIEDYCDNKGWLD